MTMGKQAIRNNIAAVRLITEIVRTSLGPRGMDKLIITDYGVVHITNDGATMLKQMSILHPAALIMVELSKATDTQVGDGTTSAVVLTGALLEKADDLLKRGVHPVLIVGGFAKASRQALKLLEENTIKRQRSKDTLVRVAATSLQSKVVSRYSRHLASLVADAVLMVAKEEPNGRYYVNMKSVKVEKKEGGSIGDTVFVRGLCLSQLLANPNMPKRLEKVKIAIYARPIRIEDESLRKHVVIRDPEMIGKFIDGEVKFVRDMVDKFRAAGANMVICQKAIDDVAKELFSRAGMMAIEKAYEYEMPKIADATGAKIMHSLDDLTEADLGYAEVVEQRKIQDDTLVFLEGCRDPKAVTILIRGGSKRVVDEAERSVHDALMVGKDTMQDPTIVAGGGAIEAEIAHGLRQWATSLEGREQLAAEKYADALEQIPMTLAENAGMNSLMAMVELRGRHANGDRTYGISADGKVKDMLEEDVMEPFAVKRQVISGATEAASMILRVDNIMTAKPYGNPPRAGMKRPEELDAPLPE